MDILVDNAAFAAYGRYETLDPAPDLEQVSVNVAVVVGLTHAFLPRWSPAAAARSSMSRRPARSSQ